jgi:hypothetical protein
MIRPSTSTTLSMAVISSESAHFGDVAVASVNDLQLSQALARCCDDPDGIGHAHARPKGAYLVRVPF